MEFTHRFISRVGQSLLWPRTALPATHTTTHTTTLTTSSIHGFSRTASTLVGRSQQLQQSSVRGKVSFQFNLRKKGARRRLWWHPKLLRNRMYKGYGAGSFMSRAEDGTWSLNQEKVRTFIKPKVDAACVEETALKPYVSVEVDINSIKTPKPTKWDYLAVMEKTWSPAKKNIFEKYQAMRNTLGQKAGDLGKWGQ